MNYVVGCDFGLVKSGVVVLGEDFELYSQNLIKSRSKGAQRLYEIELGFEKIIEPFENKIEVFVEGYAYGAKYQRESLAELGGVMRRYFYLNNINYWVIPPNSLKYFVTGSGRASKNYVKKRTKEKWGLSFKSDDVCDAHGLARLGVSSLKLIAGQQLALEPHEEEVLTDIITYQDHYRNANTSKRKKRK